MMEKFFVEAVYAFYAIVFLAIAIIAICSPVLALILLKYFFGEKVFIAALVFLLFLTGVYCGMRRS